MPARPSSSGRRPARRPASDKNSKPIVFGLAGVAVVVIGGLLLTQGGGAAADAGDRSAARSAAPPAAAAPAPAFSPAAAPLAAARAGKTPARPAPPLSEGMLDQARALLATAKDHNNAGVRQRNAGDNEGARQQQSLARQRIEEIKRLLEPALSWHEEADLGGWSMPAAYVALENLYGEVGKLEKRVRMSGGT